MPIDLSLCAPRIHQQAQRDISRVHVFPDRPFSDYTAPQLLLHTDPDPVRRMPLLTGGLPIRLQDPLDELECARISRTVRSLRS